MASDSTEAATRLGSLLQFANELLEDFPYRDDAQQAVEDIDWLRRFVAVQQCPPAE